ncbi:ribosomal L18p/L5e family protein [Actinidia rufa]|uniref:Ribosomal L18p/L5e family protein n=1 Tax=Actinidia rufa TaxID=165716 RepID=A0A7J0FP25_9ERIC|nr:ribosomal L18p/L5e family protein [Actinidia rufa]
MALGNFTSLQFTSLQFKTCHLFGTCLYPSHFLPVQSKRISIKPLVIEARANTRKESAKIRNRRLRKKFNGTPTRPRLSVFCSEKQLYAMLVDDQNKKCLFYGSTLQQSIRENPPCSTVEAAERVGDELVKACINLDIHEISSYDRNGFARGEKMQAFEVAISRHGFFTSLNRHLVLRL